MRASRPFSVCRVSTIMPESRTVMPLILAISIVFGLIGGIMAYIIT